MGTFVLVVPVLSDMNIFVLSCAKDHVFVSLIKLLSFEVFKNTLQEFIIYSRVRSYFSLLQITS